MRVIGLDAARGSGLLSATAVLSSSGNASTPPASYPDATNTGYTGTLTTYTGSLTISTDSVTIQDKNITGRLIIEAANVTLRNCNVASPGDYYVVMANGSNTLIEDCTLQGNDNAQASLVGSGTWIGRRLNVFGGQDGVTMNDDCELYDSYIHDLGGDAGSHNDGINADGHTGVVVGHCTILNSKTQTSCIWVGDSRNGPSSVSLTDSFLAGGGYSVYAGPGTSTGIQVTGNVFSTQYFANGGYYGPVISWSSPNNTWADNTWADGPNVGQPVPSS